MKTVLETITSGAEYLEKRGVEDARLNMEHLLAHSLGCRRIELYMQYDRPLEEHDLAPLRDLLRRRGSREPLQHLLGDVDFLGRTFRSDRRALIPRPETETLVEMVLDRIGHDFAGHIADIGCGTGVIGLSLIAALAEPPKQKPPREPVELEEEEVDDSETQGAGIPLDADLHYEPIVQKQVDPDEQEENPEPEPEEPTEEPETLPYKTDATITLIDISPDALALAQENATALELPADRIQSHQGDLLTGFSTDAFQVIVANLPYIESGDMPGLQAEVLHDPALALDGGADGLDLVRRLIDQLPTCLSRGGLVAFELGVGQTETVSELLTAAGLGQIETAKDLAGIERFVLARK